MPQVEFRIASWVGKPDGMSLDLYMDGRLTASVFEDDDSGERSVVFWRAGFDGMVSVADLERLLSKAGETDLSSTPAG